MKKKGKTENLKPFKPGKSGNPNGRPKLIQNLLKEAFLEEFTIKLSPIQIEEIMTGVLVKTESEIKALDNPDQPWFVRVLAKKALRDLKDESIDLANTIVNRRAGRDTQRIEHTGIDLTKGKFVIKIATGANEPTELND